MDYFYKAEWVILCKYAEHVSGSWMDARTLEFFNVCGMTHETIYFCMMSLRETDKAFKFIHRDDQ
jgi:hypothetical protein